MPSEERDGDVHPCAMAGACVPVLESDGRHVLIDPFLTGNPKAAAKADEVPADLILVSHGHGDHVGDAVAIAGRTGATVADQLRDQRVARGPARRGLTRSTGSSTAAAALRRLGRVKLTLAFHGSVLPDGSYGGNPCGFLVTFPTARRSTTPPTRRLFGDMAADRRGRARPGDPADRRLLHDGPRRRVRAVKLLQPEFVLPIHYNTFPPIAQDADAWADRVRNETSAQPVVLQPGDWFEHPQGGA